MAKSEIPVIDFSAYSLEIKEENVKESELKVLADKICEAFKTVGFVYLKNYGIGQKKVQELQALSRKFFELPHEVKLKYAQENATNNVGWLATERELLSPERPGDLKEAYDFRPNIDNEKLWPDGEIPEFKPFMKEMFDVCGELANRIHYLMGLGLKLKDPGLFRDNHNPGKKPCSTTARVLYYPPTPDGNAIKPNQIGCGEHTDYGSLTLLFQDEVGGLQVKNVKGEYVAAKPIPDTMVVNVADLMQRWTSDQLVSTEHRVILPSSSTKPRISFAYFVQPDDDCLIECIDGSNKYEAITSLDYLNKRLTETYAY